jgi:putative ABC transport system permease protein
MFLISLAWKNLLRYKRRSVITSIAITAGLAIYIVVDCMFAGMEQNSERNFVWYEAGAAQVMDQRFFKEIDYLPLLYGIADPKSVQDSLASLGVRTTPRTRFMGELFHESNSQQVMMEALDTATDGAVLRIRECVKEGKYLGDSPSGIMVGRLLAEDLGVALGDALTLRTRTRDGAFQTADFEVSGIIDSPNPYLNAGVGFIELAVAGELLQMEGAVTEILVGTEDWHRPERLSLSISGALGAGFPGLIVKNWKDLGTDFINIVNTHMMIYNVLLLLVFIIAAVGISNTMLMAVYERYREIGMMRALGMKEGSLRGSLLLEAGGIGVIGSAGGIALGAGASYALVHWGIDYSALLGRMEMGYRISGVWRGAWNPQTMIAAFCFGVVTSMLVCLVFLLFSRVMRTSITDCLHHV